MVRNHILLFLRTVKRQPLFFFVNLCGLTLSLVSTLLIYLYVDHELHYDSFHPDTDRLYRVNQTFIWAENDKSQFSRTGPGVAVALKEELPEVELVSSLHTPRGQVITYTNEAGEVVSFEEEAVLAADTNFFRIFNFPLVSGSSKGAFTLANTLMMTESTARKYFGDADPVGKLVKVRGSEQEEQTFEVIGVLKDVPEQSTIRFDVLLSIKNFPVDQHHWNWIWTQLETFVLLRKGSDIATVREKLVHIPRKRAEETLRRAMNLSYDEYLATGKKWELFLQPIETLHLPEYPVVGSFNDLGSRTVIYALIGAAVFIVLLSCINFTNLSTARFTKRIREASIRKVLGLGKRELALHYFAEALIFCVVALFVAVAITQVLLPFFNTLTQKTLAVSADNIIPVVALLATLAVTMAIVSSLYPAFFLGRFRPAEALKGKLTTGKSGQTFRNTLVVFQFSVSIILMTCTGVVFQQLRYMHQKDVGFNREHVITLRHLETVTNQDELVEAMNDIPGILQASACTAVPPAIFGGDRFTADHYDGTFALNYTSGDEGYLDALGIRLILGRNFSKEQIYDKYRVIVNEATLRKLGWPVDESVLGRKVRTVGNEEGSTIIGVVSDFNYWSLEIGVEPLAIFHINHPYRQNGPRRQVALRTEPSADLTTVLRGVQDTWKQHAGDIPFDYGFVDEAFEETFNTQQRFGYVLVVMATLAILIACFGLLGMIVYAIEHRTKEIGIRKVSGASVGDILMLITNSFTRLVVVAFIIAAPVAYLAMERWLTEFAYRVEPSLWVFAIAGLGTLALAVMITSYHSVKAARTNPVEVLRDE